MNSDMTPFDPDDWKRRYRTAVVAAHKAASAGDDAAGRPLETLLQEWADAHPGRDYFEARDPNKPPAWPPEITASLLFVHCKAQVPCARCGKKRKRHWTMVLPFKAALMGSVALDLGTEVFYPLTPVCDDHPLQPANLPDETSPEPEP